MADEFPPTDVIYVILSRLPIKSLARFRSVCKSWLKCINDPYLQTIHRVKEEPTPIMFQLVRPALSNIDNSTLCKISFLGVTQGGTMSVKKYHFLDVPYSSFHSYRTLLTLINPLTKRRHYLPPIDHRPPFRDCQGQLQAAGIAFNDSTNRVTTVCILHKESPPGINPQLCIIHDSGMYWWREVAQNPAYPIRGECVFAHGRLHWLACHNDNSYYDERKIVWFDVKKEEFGLTNFAPEIGLYGLYGQYGQLVDLNGEVGFAYKYDGIGIELWVLKREEWVLHCRFDQDMLRYIDVVVCGCWNDDGDILLTSNGGKKRLFVYTLKTDDLKEVELDGRCEAAIRMHRSSFFSIRGINPRT
ncbi:F-box protein At5g49610-like [Bidens hawaiensis]|uniref:F-box protein At5g49610-like n=1 Tax=Bidens hawaiensis TaxID=980011 RepID=UPI00404B836A